MPKTDFSYYELMQTRLSKWVCRQKHKCFAVTCCFKTTTESFCKQFDKIQVKQQWSAKENNNIHYVHICLMGVWLMIMFGGTLVNIFKQSFIPSFAIYVLKIKISMNVIFNEHNTNALYVTVTVKHLGTSL